MARVGRQKANGFWELAGENVSSYRYYVDLFTVAALSRYTWTGLPDTVDVPYMERQLISTGRAVVFVDEVMGALSLGVNDYGGFDVYGYPAHRVGIGANGYHSDTLDADNSVLVYNNMNRIGDASTIIYFARRLWDLDRTIDVNCKAQKTPLLVYSSENEILTLKNVFMQVDGNAPAIWLKKGKMDLAETVKVLDLKAPFVAAQIYQMAEQISADCFRALGILSTRAKTERLIAAEAEANLSSTIAIQQSGLMARQEAAEKMNRIFGWNVTVQYNERLNVPVPDALREGGELEVGDLHDGTADNL